MISPWVSRHPARRALSFLFGVERWDLGLRSSFQREAIKVQLYRIGVVSRMYPVMGSTRVRFGLEYHTEAFELQQEGQPWGYI